MRAALIAASLVVVAAGVAHAEEAHDVEVTRRNIAEESRLLDLYAHTFVGAVAGYNHRHAICDQTKAQAMDEFDRANRTTFRRTLGWRWDATAALFVVAYPAQADVTLSFFGPVRSGWVKVGGKTVWFCRAEAPDRLEATAKLPKPYGFETTPRKLTLVPGFVDLVGSKHVTDAPAESSPVTPQPQIEARIAEAAALLEPGRIAPSLVPRLGLECPEAEARQGIERRLRGSSGSMDQRQYLRRGAKDAWVAASEADAEVSLEVRFPAYYGPLRDGDRTRWFCASALPGTATASAHWQQEGDVTLSFTVPPPADP